MSELVLNGEKIGAFPNRFMGLDTDTLRENFNNLKSIRMHITDNEKPKPYANLEIRIWNPPTVALKEVIDQAYPIRMLTQDRQFIKNLSGKDKISNHKR